MVFVGVDLNTGVTAPQDTGPDFLAYVFQEIQR